jgi:hypothetical protein
MDNQIFQAICVRVADEKDPQIVELFKNRLRLLLREDTPQTFPDQGFPEQPPEIRWGLG